jgi:hypothetical protein
LSKKAVSVGCVKKAVSVGFCYLSHGLQQRDPVACARCQRRGLRAVPRVHGVHVSGYAGLGDFELFEGGVAGDGGVLQRQLT